MPLRRKAISGFRGGCRGITCKGRPRIAGITQAGHSTHGRVQSVTGPDVGIGQQIKTADIHRDT